jgi:hypothetical protein
MPSNMTFWVVPLFDPTVSLAFVPRGYVDTTAAWATAGTARTQATITMPVL